MDAVNLQSKVGVVDRKEWVAFKNFTRTSETSLYKSLDQTNVESLDTDMLAWDRTVTTLIALRNMHNVRSLVQ